MGAHKPVKTDPQRAGRTILLERDGCAILRV